MIRKIFKRELKDMLLDWRFAVFAAMLVLLGSVVTVARSADHKQALRDYGTIEIMNSRMLDGGLSVNEGSFFLQPPRRPARMSLIAQGMQESLMERFFLSVYENPLSVLYPSADLLMVMGIVISLGALLLSSDLICGERETGTIRLLAANAVKRSSILLGKWLACLVTLSTGILLLFVVVAVILGLAQPDTWTQTDWGSFAALFLFSLIYASTFLMMGLFLSASTRHSGTAVVMALMVWTVVVFVMPALPVYLARELQPAKSPTYVMISTLRLEKERNEALEKLRAPLRAQKLSDAEMDARIDTNAVRRIWDEFSQKKRKVENPAFEKSMVQGGINLIMQQASPFAAYLIGGTEITGVGVVSAMNFTKFAQKQERFLTEYIQEKWREALKKNPDASKSTPLDLSGRPRSAFKGDPLLFRMAGMALPLLFLLIFNVLFFMLAWRKFLRYDVR